MISHKLTPEQQEYQKLARDFAAREIASQAPKYDQSADFAGDIFAKLWQTGLANAAVPESLNGLGLSCFDNCLIAEELAYGCSGIAGSVEASSIAQQFVIDFGSDEQKSKFLSPLIDEACLAGFGMSGGIKNARVFYRKEGEQFVLSGKHPAFVNAGIAQWYLGAASEDRREVTSRGSELVSKERFSYFLVSADDEIDFGERCKDARPCVSTCIMSSFSKITIPCI